MGCCKERIGHRQSQEEINIDYELVLEKIRNLIKFIDKKFRTKQNQIDYSDELIFLQNITSYLIVFTSALEDKILDNPVILSDLDIKKIYYFAIDVEHLYNQKNIKMNEEILISVQDLYNRLNAVFHLPRNLPKSQFIQSLKMD